MSTSGIDNLKIMISQIKNESVKPQLKNYQSEKSHSDDLQIKLSNGKKSNTVGQSLNINLNNVNTFFITYY